MGGLARRVRYIKAFQEKLNRTPTLLVDTGYYLADERSTHGELRFDVVVKNDAVLKAYEQFPVDVLNISAHDLRFISRVMKKDQAANHPILKRAVSANILSQSADITAPQPFVIREVPNLRAGAQTAKPLRVAFVGLAEQQPVPPRGLKIEDAVAAAKRVAPEAKRKADIVVALAHLKTEETLRLAREVPAIDVIIAGNGEPFTPPLKVGATLIVFTPYETRMLGELHLYRDAQGKLSTRERYISLDEIVSDDPVALPVVTAASAAEHEARVKAKDLLSSWTASARARAASAQAVNSQAREAKPFYVSSATCAECHSAQYVQWAGTRHARATDPIVSKPHEFEASCLNCHATGSQDGELPQLQSVQCEQCHGPGSNHAGKPGKGYGRIPDVNKVCNACHTAEISPKFDALAAWAKIKH